MINKHVDLSFQRNYVDFRPVSKIKSNDSNANRRQRLQNQSWRVNCDSQSIIDHFACAEYLAKFLSNCEKVSSAAKNGLAFVAKQDKSYNDSKIAVHKL